MVHDGESIHVVPELAQKEAPPSYTAAQADSAPSYFETIVHAPSSGLDGEVLVDAMREHRGPCSCIYSEIAHEKQPDRFSRLLGQCSFRYHSSTSDSFLPISSTRKLIRSPSW